MRISDWSSDVCSSDLPAGHRRDGAGTRGQADHPTGNEEREPGFQGHADYLHSTSAGRPAGASVQSGEPLPRFTGSLSLRFIALRMRMFSASTLSEKAIAK